MLSAKCKWFHFSWAGPPRIFPVRAQQITANEPKPNPNPNPKPRSLTANIN